MDFDTKSGFTQTAKSQRPGAEGYRIPTLDNGAIIVGQIGDFSALARKLEKSYGGDLMFGTPSLVIEFPTKDAPLTGHGPHAPIYLTWNEAYNLGWSLIKTALVSLFG